MIYLLAKYTLLFLIASMLGFALGYWWSRRSFVDVSESFESLQRAAERSDRQDWDKLWARLDALPAPVEPDFSDITARVNSLHETVSALPKPAEPDFSDITARVKSLHETVSGIPKPVEADFSDINARVSALHETVNALPTPRDPDFAAVNSELASLRQSIAAIPLPPPAKDVDLSSIERELADLRVAIRNVPVVETHEAPDLRPFYARFDRLDSELKSRPAPAAPIADTHREPSKPGQPVILSAALFGAADDLKRISGVGPKLEKLLHKNGVYYFWQVASWKPADIEVIDERLDVFKGRISRDNWVTQAKSLRQEPGAASMPAENRA